MLILPLMMSDDPELNFENVHQSNEKSSAFRRRLYKNQKLQKIIKSLLPKFDQLGLLDAMWCKVIYAELSKYTRDFQVKKRWKLSLFTFNTVAWLFHKQLYN